MAQNNELHFLSVKELRSKPIEELRIIRNDIFARHGYTFNNPELKAYFSKKYKNISKSLTNNIILTKMEKEYVDLVKRIEKEKESSSNDTLLKVISLLPGKSRGTWDWSVEDRKTFVDAYKKTESLSNDDSGMFQKQFISDSHFFVQVVDGSWSLKLFKANDGSYLVLAVDHVGDGSSFTTYQYKNGKLNKSKIEFYNLLPKQLFTNFYNYKDNCNEHYEDNSYALLDYVFKENDIKLYDYYAKNNKECFNYDTIVLEFNKDTKRFVQKDAYWKKINKKHENYILYNIVVFNATNSFWAKVLNKRPRWRRCKRHRFN